MMIGLRWLVVLLALGLGRGVAVELPATVEAKRFPGNPIIRPGMPHLPGENINGPSLIRAPYWLPKPPGKYLLYFADHHGQEIHLATADQLTGPWTIFPGGVLRLDQTVCKKHIASPDVHVDAANKEILMYFHGPSKGGEQLTYLARSKDGLHFTAGTVALGKSYFRVFRYNGWFYTITKQNGAGILFRSRDGVTPFEQGPALVPNMRHAAMKLDGDRLWLFYSQIGDAPEQVLVSQIDMRPDWQQWKVTGTALLLKPEKDYEGVGLPVKPSVGGAAKKPVHELRDPAIFEENGKTWLLYSIAGERGLALAELTFH
ncbi:MAG: hypothetical protein NTY53_10980 [Kiritimatiellaeota bacterium]|nr:hypothetical protein [Kiritimatiellota bacterium]